MYLQYVYVIVDATMYHSASLYCNCIIHTHTHLYLKQKMHHVGTHASQESLHIFLDASVSADRQWLTLENGRHQLRMPSFQGCCNHSRGFPENSVPGSPTSSGLL